MHQASVEAIGRSYPWPKVPAIVICLDGCEPAYLDEAVAAGVVPAIQRILEKGTSQIAHSCREDVGDRSLGAADFALFETVDAVERNLRDERLETRGSIRR